MPFDFVINGEILHASLEKFMVLRSLSAVRVALAWTLFVPAAGALAENPHLPAGRHPDGRVHPCSRPAKARGKRAALPLNAAVGPVASSARAPSFGVTHFARSHWTDRDQARGLGLRHLGALVARPCQWVIRLSCPPLGRERRAGRRAPRPHRRCAALIVISGAPHASWRGGVIASTVRML